MASVSSASFGRSCLFLWFQILPGWLPALFVLPSGWVFLSSASCANLHHPLHRSPFCFSVNSYKHRIIVGFRVDLVAIGLFAVLWLLVVVFVCLFGCERW